LLAFDHRGELAVDRDHGVAAHLVAAVMQVRRALAVTHEAADPQLACVAATKSGADEDLVQQPGGRVGHLGEAGRVLDLGHDRFRERPRRALTTAKVITGIDDGSRLQPR